MFVSRQRNNQDKLSLTRTSLQSFCKLESTFDSDLGVFRARSKTFLITCLSKFAFIY